MRGLKGLVFKQDCFLCRYRFDSNGHQGLRVLIHFQRHLTFV